MDKFSELVEKRANKQIELIITIQKISDRDLKAKINKLAQEVSDLNHEIIMNLMGK